MHCSFYTIWCSVAAMTSALIFIMVLLAQPANAQEPFTVSGNYYLDFSGVPVGKLWASAQFDGETCHTQTSLKTKGMVRVFKKLKTYTNATARLEEKRWVPTQYHYYRKEVEEPDSVTLKYSPSGAVVYRKVEGEDDPNWRPRVPAQKVKAVWNPATTLCGLASVLNGQEIGATKEVPLYDGKRYFTVHIERVEEEKFRLSRTLNDGFTPKEHKRYEKGEPPLYLYHRQGEQLPYAVNVDLGYGSVNIAFEAD